MTEKQQEKIDDYLLGRAADRAAFERELAADPDLAAGLADTREAIDAIELTGDAALKARLRQLEGELRGEGATVRPIGSAPPRRRPLVRYLALAAAVLLLLTAGWFLLRPGSTDAGDLYALADYEPYPNIAYSITKGTDEVAAGEAARREAFLAYEAGDMTTAADRFAALPPDPVNRFYLGQAQLATERFAAAAATLAPLGQMADFNLAAESRYYRAVALLGSGDRTAATALLQPLAAGPASDAQRMAAALLEKLR